MRAGDQETEEQILSGLRQRDSGALRELVDHYGEALMRTAYLHLGDVHAADDAVQETFIAAWDGARRTRAATRLRPWLFGILYNRCRTFRRSLWRRLRRQWAAGERPLAGPDGEQEGRERLERLRQALSRLDEAFRVVIILRFERGLSISETAQALGLPDGTVKSRTHTAIRKLKAYMRQP